MTWMKAGEFECENGYKAVVLGRIPDPSDQPKFPWVGYVTVLKDQGDPRWIRMSWTDDGKCSCNSHYNIKPPTQVRYMGVGVLGNVGQCLYHSLKDAVAGTIKTQFVIRMDFRGGKLCDVRNLVVFIPNGPNAWKQMGLGELFLTTILNPTGDRSVESKHSLSEEF